MMLRVILHLQFVHDYLYTSIKYITTRDNSLITTNNIGPNSAPSIPKTNTPPAIAKPVKYG